MVSSFLELKEYKIVCLVLCCYQTVFFGTEMPVNAGTNSIRRIQVRYGYHDSATWHVMPAAIWCGDRWQVEIKNTGVHESCSLCVFDSETGVLAIADTEARHLLKTQASSRVFGQEEV